MTAPMPEWPDQDDSGPNASDDMRYANDMLVAALARLRVAVEALQFVTNRQHLFFAECDDAEEIIVRVDKALALIGELPGEAK